MAHARRLLLVYNADWSLLGGIRYAAHRIETGEDPCALCEITYDGVRENAQWKRCRLSFDVPVEGVYRNQMDADLAEATRGAFPCVVADTDAGYVRLIGPEELDSCRNDDDSVGCLQGSLSEALERQDVTV